MTDDWAEIADTFVDKHYRSLHGRVRLYVIEQHLASHLPGPPAAIVDVGGGAGNQSIPLARRGYRVTIVDSSPSMLERAERVLASQPPEVAARVTLVEAAGEDAPGVLDERFDAVLCHGVVPYLSDPSGMLDALAGLARPHGLVSIVGKSQAGLVVRPALDGRWREALSQFGAEGEINRLGRQTRADSIETLTDRMRLIGVELIEWYGVRLFTDGWVEEDIDEDEVSDVQAVELEASRRDPYRQLSRLFHWVGQRI
ncbi:MAG: class I SAM-dependent methyltransferase [Acidimicrobiia bacterium]